MSVGRAYWGPGCTRVAGPRIYCPFVAWGRWGRAQDGDVPVHSSAWGFAPEESAHRRCGAHGGRVRLVHEGNTYLPTCSWSRLGSEGMGGKAKIPPPTRPLPRAPVLLNKHALPVEFTTCAREPLRTRKHLRLRYLRGRLRCIRAAPADGHVVDGVMMWINAGEENSGASEGALYVEADVVAEVRSVYTNSPRSWCLRRPYDPAYRTSSACKHWLWTRTAGTREDMGPRLPEAALPTCEAHGALGEQGLSSVASTHHTASSSNVTLHAEACEPVLCSRLSSTLSSVQSTSLHSHFYTVSRIRTPCPKPKRPSSSPPPGRADLSVTPSSSKSTLHQWAA